MLRLNIKFNKSWSAAILVTLSILGLSLSSNANADIFDWANENDEENFTGQSFGFLASFLGANDVFSTEQDHETTNISVIQNSSLISLSSPITAKTAPVAKTATIKLREMIVAASAYSSTPDQTDSSPFITAWNTHVRDGIIATNFLPFGTKIKIPDLYGDKVFVVEDRMNRRYWHKIDLWFPDRQSALEFGVKNIKIQILES